MDLLRFLALVVGTALLTLAQASVLGRRGAEFSMRVYSNVVVPFAWISLALGMVMAALQAR